MVQNVMYGTAIQIPDVAVVGFAPKNSIVALLL